MSPAMPSSKAKAMKPSPTAIALRQKRRSFTTSMLDRASNSARMDCSAIDQAHRPGIVDPRHAGARHGEEEALALELHHREPPGGTQRYRVHHLDQPLARAAAGGHARLR